MSYCLHQKKPTTQHKNAKQQYSFLIYANYQPLEKKSRHHLKILLFLEQFKL